MADEQLPRVPEVPEVPTAPVEQVGPAESVAPEAPVVPQAPEAPVAPPAPLPEAPFAGGPRRKPLSRKTAAGVLGFALVLGVAGYFTLGGSNGAAQNSAAYIVHCDESRLTSCLMKQPDTLSPNTSPWGENATPSAQDFATRFNSSSGGAAVDEGLFKDAGLQAMAHADWDSPGSSGPSIDIVVMRFASPQGAQAETAAVDGGALGPEWSAGDTGTVPGLPGSDYISPAGHVGPDSGIHYAAAVGNLMMAVYFDNSGAPDTADFGAWATAQYRSLQSAWIPPAPQTMIAAATTSCGSKLASCLMTPPAGSSPWGADAWAGNAAPSVAQFAQQMYASSDSGRAAARLQSQGATGIVHETWIAANDDQADVVLLGFAKTQGAESRAREALVDRAGTKFTVSGPGAAGGEYFATADAQGFHQYVIYGYVGDVALEFHGFSKSATAQAEITQWAQTQLAKLSAATTTSTLAQPPLTIPANVATTPTGAGCADALGCLVAAPAGSTAFQTAGYERTASPTITQFVDYYYSQNPSYEVQVLTDFGLQSVVHRDWDAADGNQADVAILTFADAADAQAEAMNFGGNLLAEGQQVQVPGLNGAFGVVRAMQDNGYVDTELVGYAGRYSVRVHLWSPGYPNLSEALPLLENQVSALSH